MRRGKGFDIEGLQITDAAPRNRLILACFIAATVVMQMVAERDGPALRPLTGAFDASDRPLLEEISRRLEGRTARQKNPHPPGLPCLRQLGLCPARRMDRILWKAGTHRHPQRLD